MDEGEYVKLSRDRCGWGIATGIGLTMVERARACSSTSLKWVFLMRSDSMSPGQTVVTQTRYPCISDRKHPPSPIRVDLEAE
jgi:hypothetical protein